METRTLVSLLTRGAERIRVLATDVPEDQARWRPDPDAWSTLEVVNHLADEECEDFRARLEATLHRPQAPWPPTDPGGWVTSRNYNGRDLDDSVQRFLAERAASLEWLRTLVSPDWTTAHVAPFGPISAGDVAASWVAHDILHMRQLVELHWAYTTERLVPHSTAYAGTW